MTGSRDFCRSDQSGSNFVSYIDMKIPQPLGKCAQVKYILARNGKDQGHRIAGFEGGISTPLYQYCIGQQNQCLTSAADPARKLLLPKPVLVLHSVLPTTFSLLLFPLVNLFSTAVCLHLLRSINKKYQTNLSSLSCASDPIVTRISYN
jgi:hypothetical protein